MSSSSASLCGRLGLHSSNRRACARGLRRVDCERQSQPAAITATALRYGLITTKPFEVRGYFSNIFETRRLIRFSAFDGLAVGWTVFTLVPRHTSRSLAVSLRSTVRVLERGRGRKAAWRHQQRLKL